MIVFFLPLKSVNGDIRTKLLQIDYMGSLLTILGAGLIIFPLNWGGISFPWVSGQVIGCLVGGVAIFCLLFLWEWKVAKIPIVPRKLPSLFRVLVPATLLVAFCAILLGAPRTRLKRLRFRYNLQILDRQCSDAQYIHRRHGHPVSTILRVRHRWSPRWKVTHPDIRRPQYLQIVRGVSAIRSGVLVLPLLILVTVSVFTSG